MKIERLLEHAAQGKIGCRSLLICAALLLSPLCSKAQDPFSCPPSSPNPIVCENTKTGSPASQWDLDPVTGDPSIQGFATDISVNQGGTINFKISTNAKAYTITIYRMGYYGGQGARQITVIQPSVSLPQTQPGCISDSSTGMVDCGNWAVSASWAVPSNATSGVYFALLNRSDTGGANHIFFIVRNDTSTSDLLYQASDTTWQAYNDWGGNSLYCGGPGTSPGRAYKVSYNRPFNTREPDACGVQPGRSWIFNAEYPMIRWLEANGYNISYSTATDTDRYGSLLKQHKVFLSVGHDEYWSAAQRTNVEAARAAGVNLAFFTGNEVFWKIRRDNSIDGTNTPYRTMVCYKETAANAVIDPKDPPTWTGTWRDPRFSPPGDGGRPENALTGTIFMVNGQRNDSLVVPQADGRMRFWRNTAVAALKPGTSYTFPAGTLGDEWDEDLDNGFRPAGAFQLSTTNLDVSGYLLQDYGSTFGPGTATHHTMMYRYTSGALIFSSGSIQWSWGLDPNHDTGGGPADVNMQQATVNLLADMGAQPATLQTGLVGATASTDHTPPTSTITFPTAGSSIPTSSPITITGTAADIGGGVIGGVEVSVDGGVTWHPATGRESWTFGWTTPSTLGTFTVMSRATDDSGNMETPSPGVTVNSVAHACPCSIWNSAVTPGTPSVNDSTAVEVGVKFTSDLNGYITGILFYKGASNTGTHTGSLWSGSGALLATATFTNESASGWQQVTFPTAVPIAAGTTYVASYHTTVGFYSSDAQYFATSGYDDPPLHALANGTSGGNGVYVYSAGGVFPTNTSQNNATNYWVDVVFSTVAPPDNPPVISSVTASSITSGSAVITWTTDKASTSAVNYGTTTSYGSSQSSTTQVTSHSVTLTGLAANTVYHYQVQSADSLGKVGSSSDFTFTTSGPPTCPCTIWTASTTPTMVTSTDTNAVELGVKFTSDMAGYITGIRFYKGSTNTGTHTGTLWNSAGTLLATATFTNESASGWQQVNFSTPVAIAAGTTYVASYHTNVGHYSSDQQYLANSYDNAPLHALANGASGGNGVYVYGAGGAFPANSYNATNYYVDVAFNTVSNDAAPLVSGVAVSLITSSSATITWTTDKASTSVVNYGTTPSYGSSQSSSIQLTSHSITLTGLSANMLYHYQAQSADSLGMVGSSSDFTFTTLGGGTCPCTIWPPSTAPTMATAPDSGAIELGVKFTSDVAGYITGIRFYKSSTNTGTHTGSLWSSTGTLLSTATFTNETASGWQQVNFSTPVAIAAGTTYVASYHTNVGQYSSDQQYFATTYDDAPLHALASGTSGGNGVYVYGGGGAFPANSYNATNYYVDVVFNTLSNDTAPIISNVSASSITSSGAVITWTTDKSSTSVVNYGPTSSYGASQSSSTQVMSHSITLTALAANTVYHYQVQSADSLGKLGTSSDFTFTTLPNGTCPCTIWNASTTPTMVASTDANATELGVKFTSDVPGYITGIRFYKSTQNTGTHTGSLWSSAGALLSTATFTNESTSGWQQVNFSTPVAIAAGTTYVASYHTNVGYYSSDQQYLANSYDNAPLHALASGTSGGNGVYAYGAGGVFPEKAYNATNYYVDVVLATNTSSTPSVFLTSPANGATGVGSVTTVSATFNEAMNPATLTASTFVVQDASNNVVSGTLAYNSSTFTATFTPSTLLSASTTYTATVTGGSAGVQDSKGNTMPGNYSWSFTTASGSVGLWSGPYAWPSVPINMILLQNGNVMLLDGGADSGINGGLTASLWNPTTNTFTAVPNDYTNLFCSGHSPLADGRLVVMGGHTQTSVGLPDANLFDSSTNQWTPLPPMAFQRWYPTATTLPDGRVLAVSGTTNCAACFALTPEIYSADTNTWTKLQGADLVLPFYPFDFVLPDGRIFNAGTEQSAEPARVLDVYSQKWTVIDPTIMNGGSAVMYQPGKIMKSGRHYDYPAPTPYNPSVPDTSVIDMTASSPTWKAVAPMANARTYGTLTMLPDGTVLATGGSRSTDPCDITQAVYATELWSPSTQTWTTLSSMQTPRLYHSTSLLLPNGQVVVGGGGRNTPCNDYLNAEIFSPPYLFKGPQPTITSAPSTIQYGSTFFVGTPNASTISMVSLIRPGAVTHAFDQNQTFQSLNFSVTTGGLNVTAPANANYAPPGYYMLFIVNSTGVPSVAAFVNLPTALQVISVTPLKASTNSFTNTSVSAAFNAAMDPTTITTSTVQLRDPSNNLIAGTVSYNATTRTASLVPNVRLAYATTYTATIVGGTSGVKDPTGRTMTSSISWTFTTAPTSGPCPCSIWSAADVPGFPSTNDPNAGEFGVKFTADYNGYVTGIRFYKGSLNTGTHIGHLWSSTGTLLATATFTNETASGWQQVNLSTPVAITAGTEYVVSYHTSVGYYASDANYFLTGVDNSPLHALSTSAGGGNGVYTYGAASAFPISAYSATNYWVDVVFTTTGP